MLEENMYVGMFLNGKKIIETSSDTKFMNFFFEDGSYDTAPIIDGKVVVTFDAYLQEEEEIIPEEEGDPSADPLANSEEETLEEETELGFYKTLQPIPVVNEEGEEIRTTEVGSIQEVPVALGDFWVAEGWAEKVDAPAPQTLGQKIGEGINGIFNKV